MSEAHGECVERRLYGNPGDVISGAQSRVAVVKKKSHTHCLLRRIHSVTVHCFPGVDESLVGRRQGTKVNSSEGNILTSRILSKR